MDLASLEVFLMVARERSFSRAAEKLYRTQPAVSIAVRKLEEWVGQPLLLREAGGGKLTDAGVLLRGYAERMLNLREEIRKGVEELRGLGRGRVSLGVNESSIHALLPVLARFRRLHPRIHIRVHRVFSREIPREILNYRLDLGVISYRPEDVSLAAEEFYRDELTLVLAPTHRLARRRSVDIAELGEETFIAHFVASPYRRQVIQMFSKHGVPLRRDVELPTIESIKRSVEMEMGVAIVPRMCVMRELERRELVEVRLRQMRIERRLYFVYRTDRPLSAAAQAFRELLLRKKSFSSLPHRRNSRRH